MDSSLNQPLWGHHSADDLLDSRDDDVEAQLVVLNRSPPPPPSCFECIPSLETVNVYESAEDETSERTMDLLEQSMRDRLLMSNDDTESSTLSFLSGLGMGFGAGLFVATCIFTS